MIRYLRFYILPAAIFTIAFGLFFGGVWLWLPGLSFVSGIALLDHLVPLDHDESDYRHPRVLDLALYLSTPATVAIFFALFWVAGTDGADALGAGAWLGGLTGIDVVARRDQTAWYHVALMFPAIAVPITGAGGLAGHELIHRTWKRFDLWLGRATMALNWGIAFPIEHVYGHHAYVGTPRDPATAARGDSLYAHLPKAMYRTVANAVELESARLQKIGARFLSPRNTLLRLGTIALATTVAAGLLAGGRGVAFHLTVCVLTKVVLEALNYIEHYGIVRVPDAPVQPRHSWNCNHLISGVFTYNLTRHSHHHADAQVPFHRLHAEQPMMPGGFMTAYVTAWIPPLWRRRIAPKLRAWDVRHASPAERALTAVANRRSGWVELGAADEIRSAPAVGGG